MKPSEFERPAVSETIAPNIIPLGAEVKPQPKAAALPFRQRFKVVEFENRGGSKSWRVTGIKRDGTRVRENHPDAEFARKRQAQLEVEYVARPDNPETAPGAIRTTRLTDVQLRLCETALAKLSSDDELLPAVQHWLDHGRALAVAESPRMDDAVKDFKEWLETSGLRDRTRANLKVRVDVFANSIPNLRVCDVAPETIDSYLDKRNDRSARTRINDKLAISRFFSWCMDRKRRWTAINPCHAVKLKDGEKAPPAILTLDECRKLLAKAETHRRGRLAPYVALCLFGGLRPTEAQRLTRQQVNLKDREIRLEAHQTKNKRARVVAISDTLAAWLKAYDKKPFAPANWRRDFDKLKAAAGYAGRTNGDDKAREWPDDVMRHTAISHYFRKTGSYGQTAEQFGNSEAIIKKHYQGRVSTEDTKRFYALLPKKGGRK